MVGQCEIDVVATQHQMIADGHAAESGPGWRLDDRDQSEAGGAAADVTDQNQLTCPHFLLPAVLVRDDPAVKSRLWLLEQCHGGDLRAPGGLERELTRRLVERSWHRQHHLLLLEAHR